MKANIYLLSLLFHVVDAWTTHQTTAQLHAQKFAPCGSHIQSKRVVTNRMPHQLQRSPSCLRQSTSNGEPEPSLSADEDVVLLPCLTDDELGQVLALCPENSEENDKESLLESVRKVLPSLPPRLMVKLRQLESHPNHKVAQVAQALNNILNQQLEQGAELLQSLLNAGEIRRLDSLIGKAGREKRLDPAFFQVLSFNLQDAAAREEKDKSDAPQGDENDNGSPSASRYQILQHIYTRCQEEVEKTIPPEVALLNKLLRTEQPSIRSNLISHYLTPASTVIKSPDGKELNLSSTSSPKVLVPLKEFIRAVADFVEQIRTVESAGGTDRASAAAMVEACRQVAKEVRLVVADHYGDKSPELLQLQDGLQPVFRPSSSSSSSSPHIQGKANCSA